MYSITNIIYGYPITTKISNLLIEKEDDENSDWNEDGDMVCGFNKYYHGSSDGIVGYVGVELDSFDECGEMLKPSNLKMQPTEEQKNEAIKKINALSQDFKTLVGEPDVFFVFSTS